MITLSAKADNLMGRSSLLQQQLLRLRMSQCSTLTPDGPNGTSPSGIRADLITQPLRRFKSYVQDYLAQPPNLELLKNFVIVPYRAKLSHILLQKGDRRISAVA